MLFFFFGIPSIYTPLHIVPAKSLPLFCHRFTSDGLLAACPGQFPAKANDVVQWRGFRKGNSFLPYAIIYRMMSSADNERQSRLETLIIIKLDEENSKVVAHVPSREGNEKAEAVADKLCRP